MKFESLLISNILDGSSIEIHHRVIYKLKVNNPTMLHPKFWAIFSISGIYCHLLFNMLYDKFYKIIFNTQLKPQIAHLIEATYHSGGSAASTTSTLNTMD